MERLTTEAAELTASVDERQGRCVSGLMAGHDNSRPPWLRSEQLLVICLAQKPQVKPKHAYAAVSRHASVNLPPREGHSKK